MADSAVVFPVLPLRDIVLFPKLTPPSILIGREQSLSILEDVLQVGGEIFAVCQRDPENAAPAPEDLYEVGVVALVEEISIDEDTTARRVKLTGLWRGRVASIVRTAPHLEAEITRLPEQPAADNTQVPELMAALKRRFLQFAATDSQMSEQTKTISQKIADPSILADFIASRMPVPSATRQAILEELDTQHRLQQVLDLVDREHQLTELRQTIQTRVQRQMNASQRDYYLREQLKAIQRELGYNQEPEHSTGIKPIFASRISRIDTNLCFVLMPFSEPWSDRLYYKLIRPTVEGLGLQCIRADNLTGQIIIEDIWTKINQCAMIIADVTGRNANVMYELGIVHTIGKPTVLITQQMHNIPFDFAHLRHYSYEDNIDGFRELGETLRDVAIQLFKNTYGIDLASKSEPRDAVTPPRSSI